MLTIRTWVAVAGSLLLAFMLISAPGASAGAGGQVLGGPIEIDEEIEVFVRLDTPSVSEFSIEHRRTTGRLPAPAEQRGQARKVDDQQNGVRPQLERFGARVMSSTRVGINGMRARVARTEIENLRAIEGVMSIEPVELHYPMNVVSVPGIGAPTVWDEIGTGEGVTIGIIDSGVDYLHANLGGSGDPADYAANDPTTLDDGGFGYPAAAGYTANAAFTRTSTPTGSTKRGVLRWGDEVEILERGDRRTQVRPQGGLDGWVAKGDVVELRWIRRRGSRYTAPLFREPTGAAAPPRRSRPAFPPGLARPPARSIPMPTAPSRRRRKAKTCSSFASRRRRRTFEA